MDMRKVKRLYKKAFPAIERRPFFMLKQKDKLLVLDDPFVNLDEEKMAHGNELFGKISGEYQILYFTCHASRNIENAK